MLFSFQYPNYIGSLPICELSAKVTEF